jgi:hypothetical protein
VQSWNLRDQHMVETLETLVANIYTSCSIVVSLNSGGKTETLTGRPVSVPTATPPSTSLPLPNREAAQLDRR